MARFYRSLPRKAIMFQSRVVLVTSNLKIRAHSQVNVIIVTENPSQLRRTGLGDGVVRALSIQLLERHRKVTNRFPGSFWAALNTSNSLIDDHSRRTLCQARSFCSGPRAPSGA